MTLNVGALLESLGIDARQRGDEWVAICPNPKHHDRTPSWRMVDDPSSDRHGLFKCYPCGMGGNAYQLVMALLDVGYHAARSWMDEYDVPEDVDLTPVVCVESPRTFRLPPGVETSDVLTWPQPFRKYLAGRRVTVSQARRWGLAFALEGRLAGRVVIPSRNASGRLLAYTARAISQHGLRYLTPGRDEHADPSAVFGEEHWGPGGAVVVAEGSFDALAVERAVPGVAVAVLGTGGVSHAEEPRILQKLQRFEDVVVVTDSDAAGDKAFEALRDFMRSTASVRRARPPEGRDANDLAPEELRGIISHAR